uniref:Uncharacterized protein n=1 Tax=Oryza barthii TaxID=65489 RepID=A0A0D3GH26_9ORYZ
MEREEGKMERGDGCLPPAAPFIANGSVSLLFLAPSCLGWKKKQHVYMNELKYLRGLASAVSYKQFLVRSRILMLPSSKDAVSPGQLSFTLVYTIPFDYMYTTRAPTRRTEQPRANFAAGDHRRSSAERLPCPRTRRGLASTRRGRWRRACRRPGEGCASGSAAAA